MSGISNPIPRALIAVTPAILTVLLAVVLIGTPALAVAQSQPAGSPEEETVTSAQVDDVELRQFTKSIEQVLEIQQEVEAELATVQEPAQAQELQRQANTRMIEAIQEEGLEADRYNVLARSLQLDQELNQRFQQMREQLAQEEEDES